MRGAEGGVLGHRFEVLFDKFLDYVLLCAQECLP